MGTKPRTLNAWRREVWKEEVLDNIPQKGQERALVNQTNIGTVSNATLRKLLRDDVFQAHRYHLEPNQTAHC